jgi:DNA damage-binding protein 1
LAFISSKKAKHILAILFFDFTEKIRLHARELYTDKRELSPNPSLTLRECVPNIDLSILPDPSPSLIPIPFLVFNDGEHEFHGGVLVVGGTKIRLFEKTGSKYKQQHKSDHKKTEKAENANADKPGKPRASISWPWAEITAWVLSGLALQRISYPLDGVWQMRRVHGIS